MIQTDAIVARIMRIRNGMTTDEDAESIIEREIAALQPHERSSPDSASLLKLLVQAGYNPDETHPECYRNFSYVKFAELHASQPATPTDAQKAMQYHYGTPDRYVSEPARSSATDGKTKP